MNDKVKIVAQALDIEDNYEEAKEYFQREYPSIKQIPIKRLMQFSPKVQAFRAMMQDIKK